MKYYRTLATVESEKHVFNITNEVKTDSYHPGIMTILYTRHPLPANLPAKFIVYIRVIE